MQNLILLFLGLDGTRPCNNKFIAFKSEITLLGIILNENLSWHSQVLKVVSKCNLGLFYLRKLQHYVDTPTQVQLYYAFIHSHLSYSTSAWFSSYYTAYNPIYMVQNKALRIISNTKVPNSVSKYYKDYAILTFYQLGLYRLFLVSARIIS